MTDTRLSNMVTDLAAETDDLQELLLGLSASEWELPTPAQGWSVRDQVSHLAFFDEAAVMAITEPDRFRQGAKVLLGLGPDFPDQVAERFSETPIADLVEWLRTSREELLSVLSTADGSAKVPWYGPDMSVLSSATARLMETWAHGLDIADTFGVVRQPTERLKHIAHLGVRTLGFSFTLNGRPRPHTDVRVTLDAPDGGTWSWGEPGGIDSVTGSAQDFCLVVTQRRNVRDTALTVRGAVATEWMFLAQAFAGAPGPGRAPLSQQRTATSPRVPTARSRTVEAERTVGAGERP